MHIQPFRATYPILDRIPSPDDFCAEAKNAFQDYRRRQWLAQTDGPALYVYQIEDHFRQYTGLVALNSVHDFFAGKVKKHEKTLSEHEQRQMNLFLQWGAVLKPILLTYPPVAAINDWLFAFASANHPFLETRFSDDQQTHRLWQIETPEDIRLLQELFAEHIPDVYIADGHHRTSTMAMLHRNLRNSYPQLNFEYLFCAFFATNQLNILDYNRVVAGLNGLTTDEFLSRLREIANLEVVENPRKPRRKFELKMLLEEQWYRLHWKPALLENSPGVLLDVSILNEQVLHRLLGIRDVRTDARILYVDGSKGLKGIRKTVQAGAGRVGFALYPVTFEDMMLVADAGESLPPKSTYFEPRLKSGLLVKMLED